MFWPAYADLFVGFSVLLLIFFWREHTRNEELTARLQGLQAKYMAASDQETALETWRKEALQLRLEKAALEVQLTALGTDVLAARTELMQVQKQFETECIPAQVPDELVEVLLGLMQKSRVNVVVGDNTRGGLSLNFQEAQLTFPSGSARLEEVTSAQRDNLRQFGLTLVHALGQMPPEQRARYQIEIIGHTDAQPMRKDRGIDNWELSFHRAKAVMQFFEKECDLHLAKASGAQQNCTLDEPNTFFVKMIGVADTYALHPLELERMQKEGVDRWHQEAAEDRRIEIRLVPNLRYFQECNPQTGESSAAPAGSDLPRNPY